MDLSTSPALIVRCSYNSSLVKENGFDLFISWGETLGADSYIPEVLYRFNDEGIREANWNPNIGDTVRSTFVTNALSFIAEMNRWDRLAVRVKKEDGDNLTASWNIAGFRDAVRPVLEKCGHSPLVRATPSPTATPVYIPRSTPTPFAFPTPTATVRPTAIPTPTDDQKYARWYTGTLSEVESIARSLEQLSWQVDANLRMALNDSWLREFRQQVVSPTRALAVSIQSEDIPGRATTPRLVKKAAEQFSWAYGHWVDWLNSDDRISSDIMLVFKGGNDAFLKGWECLIEASPSKVNGRAVSC